MPAVNIAPYIKNQYFDDNGSILAGGLLYTYEGGTSTEKATYSDAEGTKPNENPIELDAAGRASIFLASGAYKFVLKDSDENTIWTMDNVVSSNVVTSVDTVDDLRAVTSGSTGFVQTLGYSEAGDGGGWPFYWDEDSTDFDDGGMTIQPDSLPASGRWKGATPINGEIPLKTYGAACDGETDDISELQACDTYCAANGYTILIEDDTYFSTDPSLSSSVHLLPSTILTWGEITPAIDVVIDNDDKTQHFDCTADYVPVLSVSEIYPEWFGETISDYTVTSAAIAAITSTVQKIFTKNIRTPIPFTIEIGAQTAEGAKRMVFSTTGITIGHYNGESWEEINLTA
jgi:hypothetical protein